MFDPISLLIGLVFSVGAALIQNAAKPKQKPAGVRGNVSIGGAEPLSFILGRYGTAGHLEYAGTWGSAGDTPNAYLTHVISYSDLPVRGYSRFYVYGEPVTLGDVEHPTRGWPVLEYRKGSKDHLWVRMYDGTQTTADPLLLSAFGSDPDRPWQADMIGRGVAYCVFTAKVNRELFSGFPDYFAELDGYDLGDAELNDNPIALIRQTLSGFSYDGDWLWGLQGLPATRMPAANWDAELAKCNTAIDLLGGGTEPQFRAGAEVTVDQQPIEVIEELLNSCSGRIAEIGGVYKVLVGAPGMPVASFTDEDIIITEGQSYEPFPGLEATYNGVNATYPEPAEKWGLKDAPALRDEELEAEDDTRRLPATVSFPFVASATQGQRLMQAMHRESRRFRTHSMTMPPEWWEYEVLDPVEWNSTRNGYDDKVGLITVMDDLSNGNQFIGWREQEPEDYAWVPETDEQPYATAPLVIARPAPQQIIGFAVEPYTGVDADANPRRPGFRIYGYGAGLDDVREIWVQARLPETSALIIDGRAPYDITEVAPSVAWAGDPLLPNMAYEVRGKLEPFSGRETEWSAWLPVTTPNVRLGMNDIEIELGEIAGEITDHLNTAFGIFRDLRGTLARMGTLLSEQDLANYNDRLQLMRQIAVSMGEARAEYLELIEVAVGPDSAIVQKIENAYVALGGNEAEIRVRWNVEAGPTGYDVQYGLQLYGNDGSPRAATMYGRLPSDPDEPSEWVFDANRVIFADTSGNETKLILFEDGNATLEELRFKRHRSIAETGSGTPIIDMVGETGYFGITVNTP